jgi:predicted amidohydrolase
MESRTVRVAAAQATPAILDAEASVAKAVGLIEQAAAEGAELVVLPETFVPLYPSQSWAAPASTARSASTSASPSARARSTTRSCCSVPRACSGSTAS